MNGQNAMNISERIYQLRKESGKSQGELAQLLGVSRQSVSKWENGTSNPEIENLIELSKIFGVSVDQIVNYQGEESEVETLAQTPQQISKTAGVITLASGVIVALLGLFISVVIAFFGYVAAVVGICMLTFKKEETLHNSWVIFAITFFSITWFSTGSLYGFMSMFFTLGIAETIKVMPLQILISVFLSGFFTILAVITIIKSENLQSKINRAIFVFFVYAISIITPLISAPFTGGFGLPCQIYITLAVYVAFVLSYIICVGKRLLTPKNNVKFLLGIISTFVFNIVMCIIQFVQYNQGIAQAINAYTCFYTVSIAIFIFIFAKLTKKQKELNCEK